MLVDAGDREDVVLVLELGHQLTLLSCLVEMLVVCCSPAAILRGGRERDRYRVPCCCTFDSRAETDALVFILLRTQTMASLLPPNPLVAPVPLHLLVLPPLVLVLVTLGVFFFLLSLLTAANCDFLGVVPGLAPGGTSRLGFVDVLINQADFLGFLDWFRRGLESFGGADGHA